MTKRHWADSASRVHAMGVIRVGLVEVFEVFEVFEAGDVVGLRGARQRLTRCQTTPARSIRTPLTSLGPCADSRLMVGQRVCLRWVIYYRYSADRARRSLRGINEQIAKAEKAVAGLAGPR